MIEKLKQMVPISQTDNTVSRKHEWYQNFEAGSSREIVGSSPELQMTKQVLRNLETAMASRLISQSRNQKAMGQISYGGINIADTAATRKSQDSKSSQQTETIEEEDDNLPTDFMAESEYMEYKRELLDANFSELSLGLSEDHEK